MGECYSCQSQSAKSTYSTETDMSLASNTSGRAERSGPYGRPSRGGFGFRYNKANSKLPASVLQHRPPLRSLNKTDSQGTTNTGANTSSGFASRFGFRSSAGGHDVASDTNSNLLSQQSDSLDSLDSGPRGRRSPANQGKQRPASSFIPRDCDRWKMIDDGSTTTSDARSQSTDGRRSEAITPNDNHVDNNGNSAVTSIKLITGLPGPNVARGSTMAANGKADKWVKAGPISTPTHLEEAPLIPPAPTTGKPPTGEGGAKRRFGFFSKKPSAKANSPKGSSPKGTSPKGTSPKAHQPDNEKVAKVGSRLAGKSAGSPRQMSRALLAQAEDTGSSSDTLSAVPASQQPPPSDSSTTTLEAVVMEPVPATRSEPLPCATVDVPASQGTGERERQDSQPKVGLENARRSSNPLETARRSSNLSENSRRESNPKKTSLDMSVGKKNSYDGGRRKKDSLENRLMTMSMTDSVDLGSMTSLNSDDLMLDCDLDEDDPASMSTSTLDRSVFQSEPPPKPPRAPQPVDSGAAHKPLQREPSDGAFENLPAAQDHEGGGALRRTMSGRRRHPSSTSEAVDELSDLLQEEAAAAASQVIRRPPRLQRNNRPASFPGPLKPDESVDLRRSMMLRAPRQQSIADDEQIMMDGNTLRHLMQDITLIKTNLFKLKRSIQEDELSSPMNPTWKNGFQKLPGTPESPCIRDDSRLFSFLEKIEDTEPSPSAVQQENVQLREQVSQLQKQIADHEQTIKLLQRQMTKYECDESHGQHRSNASTQTEKPRSALTKGVLRPSTRPRSAAETSGQPVISLNAKEKVHETKTESTESFFSRLSRPKNLTLAKDRNCGIPKPSSGVPRAIPCRRISSSTGSIPVSRSVDSATPCFPPSPTKSLPSPALTRRSFPAAAMKSPPSPSPGRSARSETRAVSSPRPCRRAPSPNIMSPLSPTPSGVTSPTNKHPPSPSLSRHNVTKFDKSRTQLKSFKNFTIDNNRRS